MIRATIALALSVYAVVVALSEPRSNEPACWLLLAGAILLSIAIFPGKKDKS